MTVVGNGPWSEPSNVGDPGSDVTRNRPRWTPRRVTRRSNGRLTATWSLPGDYSDGGSALTGYRLTAINPDAIPTTVAIGSPPTFSGAITGLDDNTKYTVQVTALNTYGEGSAVARTARRALTRPGAPSTPTAGATGTAGQRRCSTFTPPAGGDVADLTNVRAHVGSTFTTPVDSPHRLPGPGQLLDHGHGRQRSSSSTTITVQAENATGWGPESGNLVIAADTTPPTVAITFPVNVGVRPAAWNAGCGNAVARSAAPPRTRSRARSRT